MHTVMEKSDDMAIYILTLGNVSRASCSFKLASLSASSPPCSPFAAPWWNMARGTEKAKFGS